VVETVGGYDIAEKRLVWIPVRWPGVQAPDGNGALAENVTHEIECQVELVDEEEVKAVFGGDLSDLEKFKRVVHDWRGVRMDRTSAPMTDGNISRILAVPMFKKGLEVSYLEAWSGQLRTREKNSESSSDDGRAEKPAAKSKTKATT
jgi:hypothetical protein